MVERIRIKRKPKLSILDACDDLHLFGNSFKNPASWSAWRSFLASLFGLPLNQAQLQTFRECTQKEAPPKGGTNEAWLVCGRRGGKSFTLAVIAVYLACFKDWRPYLQKGEKATIMVVAADRKQARVIMRFINGLLHNSPMLKELIVSQRKDEIGLRGQVQLEIHTASFRSTRGYTIVAALLDELAFWPTDDAADPDQEVIAALRPGMSMIPDAMLLCASSPHARKGALWEAYKKHFGKDSDVLVWQAPTRTMNPSVRQSWIDGEIERDRAKPSSKYLATFRTDVETFVSREVVEACVVNWVRERAFQPGIAYIAGVDMSGGSVDSAALAISHYDKSRDTVILDLLRERKAPHSPENVIREFSNTLKSYNIYRVKGDRYAGQYPVEQFRKFNIAYEANEQNKSAIYIDFLPLLNSARVELLDSDRLVNQLCALERKSARFGKNSVDHPINSHDDLINAAAVSMVNASLPYGTYDPFMGCGSPENAESVAEEARAWKVGGLLQHIYRTG